MNGYRDGKKNVRIQQILRELATSMLRQLSRGIDFFSDIVKTACIYYFMLREYMCEVLKFLTIQNQRKLSLKKRSKKRLNTEFPMLREK